MVEQPGEQPARRTSTLRDDGRRWRLRRRQGGDAQSKYDSERRRCVRRARVQDVLTISEARRRTRSNWRSCSRTSSRSGSRSTRSRSNARRCTRSCEDPNTRWQLCTAHRVGQGLPGRVHVRAPAVLAERDRPGVVLQRPMVGVTPEMLTERGYDVGRRAERRGADPALHAAHGRDERVQCWADLDTYLMEEVVPWVPYLFDNNVVVLSANGSRTGRSTSSRACRRSTAWRSRPADAAPGTGVAPLRGATPTSRPRPSQEVASSAARSR